MSRFYSILLFTSLFAFAIRSFHSDTLPLYIDEVSIGYNAYSILTTGKDEHGISTPLFFRAFGEYKLPVYIYATGLSQLFLGKTDAAVRLPSILAGTFAVFFLALFIRLLSKNAILSLLSAFILAITPWHIQFSRAGFEANVALSLVLIGSYFLIKEIMRKRFSFLGLFFMILSLYTYNAERVFVPLFLIAIWQILYKRVTSGRLARRSPDVIGTNAGPANVRILMLCLMVFSIILLPILSFSFSPEGMIRASSESFTKDVRVQVEDFFQSVPIHTLQQFLKNYLSNFSLDFLFFSGDGNGRHGVREMGLLYLWQLPFIVVGIVNLIKKAGDASPAMAGRATGLRLPKHMLRPAKAGPAAIQNIMMLWLLLSPLASSLTRPNPHALRSLLMVIPLAYFTAVGILSMKYYVLSIRYYVAGIKHFVLHRSWLTLTPAERDKVFFVLCYLLFVVCSLLFVICYFFLKAPAGKTLLPVFVFPTATAHE